MGKDERITVQLGTQVEIVLIYRSGHEETLLFDLVNDSHADIKNGFLSVSTTLAKAILGEIPGTKIPYFTSELQAVQILTVQQTTRKPDTTTSSRREKVIENTLDEIEFRNAILFASSTDTKWGSYDADGLDYRNWSSEQNSSEDEPK
jgi:hypothetical protein